MVTPNDATPLPNGPSSAEKTSSAEKSSEPVDLRVYVPHPEGWVAHLKMGWEKQYCYAKNPGEDHFHLILNGEIFLQKANEVYCLNCAKRQEILTTERDYWQQ